MQGLAKVAAERRELQNVPKCLVSYHGPHQSCTLNLWVCGFGEQVTRDPPHLRSPSPLRPAAGPAPPAAGAQSVARCHAAAVSASLPLSLGEREASPTEG